MEIGSTAPASAQATLQAAWPKLTLSSEHLKLWMETRTMVLWSQPAFADVWYRMMPDKDKELAWFTDKTLNAATDGQFMYINPATFFKRPLKHRVYICCHEIAHCIFDHCGIGYHLQKLGKIVYPDGIVLPYDNDISQVSCDCLINDMLIRGKVGEVPPDAIHGEAGITYEDDFFSAYRKLFEQTFGKVGKGGGLKNYASKLTPKSNSFDEHLPPGQPQGKSSQKAQEERNPQAWDNALSAALKAAKRSGEFSAVLERGLSKILEPQIDWRDQFQFAVSKRIGNDNSTWSMLDNELMLQGIGAPGKTKYGCELVVCVNDTSGSINQITVDIFMTECIGVLEQARPARMILIQCDAKITEWVEIEDVNDLIGRKIRGGGDTDFRPPFDRLHQEGLEPDCLIYLTDLDGTFPSAPPSYPIIWATISKGRKAPFGETIEIPKQLSE